MKPLWFALLVLLLQISSAVSQIPNYQYANPVQVKIDSFLVKLGPTNTDSAPPLSLADAQVILGITEDLIANFCQKHFAGTEDTEFKYSILSLVELWEQGESEEGTTVLQISGGVSYFGGSSSVLPSKAEMQMLVDLSLSSDALVPAVSQRFPHITYAAYAPETEGFDNEQDFVLGENGTEAEQQESDEEGPDFVVNQAIQGEDLADDSDDDQLLIPVLSAGAGALVVTVLLVSLFIKRKKAGRESLWREDVVKDAAESVDDLALDGYYDNTKQKKQKKRRSNGMAKRKSLQTRDSLRDMAENDAKSDAGSSLVGRLLSSAAATIPTCTSKDEGDAHTEDKANNSRGSGDTHSSSDMSDDKSQAHSDEAVGPSDFEGNAVVKPNLIPISDPDSFDDDVHEPIPPSRTASARRDELPIRLASSQQPESSADDDNKGPEKRTYYTHENFLGKFWNPITLPLGSYFGTGYTRDENSKGDFTPRTPATDQDARWSDVSSDRYTEDFELDKAWDPDDASFNSGEVDREIFSPMSAKKSHEDKVELLKASTTDSKYNLEKLRTPPPKAKSAQDHRPTTKNIENTATV